VVIDRRALLRLGLTGAAAALAEHVRARRARAAAPPVPRDARERHLGPIRQLTFGGQNAEAYFDASGERLVFQSTRPPFGCDQIFTMRADGSDVRLVSTGRGRTTCAFFFPDGRLLWASTHEASADCPPPPDRSRGYVWPLHEYDLYTSGADGSDLRRIVAHPGYDAEGAVAPDGRRIVFTSLREGDLDLYLCDAAGGQVRRLTDRPGYDGGPFFSWDGRQIVWRGYHPADPAALAEYRELLGRGLVRPHRAELFVMDGDGRGVRQVTANGAANWAPCLHPDGERIVFASNLHDPGRFDFALYLVRRDGGGLERLTWVESFVAFPMFARDGRRLVFCGNRGAAAPREYNVFVADWVD
jgi:Tol biopolymer transport system component